MGLYPCPRCLVIKGDIPEVGSFLNMKNRQKSACVYSIENVEIACKAIFNSGRSISYRGDHDMLKTGPWVLTQVCCFLCFCHKQLTAPSQNAYTTKLGLNSPTLMAVDPLHDIKLGFGHDIALHIIHLLHTLGGGAIQCFDAQLVFFICLEILLSSNIRL